jgi:HPt (histidine-containing phosphotransfer) domain-containing protein
MSKPELYDLDSLKQIARGDEDFIHKMLEIFKKLGRETIVNFQQALENEDWDMAGKAAHKVKPSIDQLNISSIKGTVRKIEDFPKKKGDTEDVKQWIEEVTETLKRVMADL